MGRVRELFVAMRSSFLFSDATNRILFGIGRPFSSSAVPSIGDALLTLDVITDGVKRTAIRN